MRPITDRHDDAEPARPERVALWLAGVEPVQDEARPDHELVARIRAGDVAAFETLFHAYYRHLCAFIAGFVGSEDVASELVQELLWQIWEGRATWDVRGSVKQYLYGAARNRALNHLRHERVVVRWEAQATRDLRLSGMGQGPEPAEDRLQGIQLADALRDAVHRLPPRRREAFTLRWRHRLTNAEIASVMGVSIKSVERQLMLALRTLREVLDPLL